MLSKIAPLTGPNIFTISASDYGPEDRFTAHLGYLFDVIPELGQAWLDHLRRAAGLAPDKFVNAGKHAEGTRSDQPDFLIIGEREDILCEHKLGAPLGPAQLERYLAFANERTARNGRPTKLAFVTKVSASISDVVRDDSAYLRPAAGQDVPTGHVPYFRWEELYPLVAARPERLACEFTADMSARGLRPINTRDWSDLFTNPARTADFAAQWTLVRDHFRDRGAQIVVRPTVSPGIEIRGARSWLHQCYLKPERSLTPPMEGLQAPVLRASIAAVASDAAAVAALSEAPAGVITINRDESSGPNVPLTIHVRPSDCGMDSRNPGVVWCREYVLSLDAILADAATEGGESRIPERLLAFATAVLDDATTICERT